MSTLSTDRLLLRSINDNDLEFIFKGLSNPEVVRFYGVSYDSKESTREQLKWYAELEKNQTGKWWAICGKDNNHFYGAIGLNDVIPHHMKGEIGFWLLPDYWGNGYIREVLPLVCEYGFQKMGLHRIEGIVENGNEKSAQVLRRHGFTYEGTMQDCEVKNGEFISLEVYALIEK